MSVHLVDRRRPARCRRSARGRPGCGGGTVIPLAGAPRPRRTTSSATSSWADSSVRYSVATPPLGSVGRQRDALLLDPAREGRRGAVVVGDELVGAEARASGDVRVDGRRVEGEVRRGRDARRPARPPRPARPARRCRRADPPPTSAGSAARPTGRVTSVDHQDHAGRSDPDEQHRQHDRQHEVAPAAPCGPARRGSSSITDPSVPSVPSCTRTLCPLRQRHQQTRYFAAVPVRDGSHPGGPNT